VLVEVTDLPQDRLRDDDDDNDDYYDDDDYDDT
jgi:hypothetical protein